MDFLPVKRNKPFSKIDHQTAAGIYGIRAAALVAAVAQGRPDAGHQLRCAERLGDVIIGAPVQSRHLFIFLGPGRDDDNGRSGKTADAADNIHSVHIRKPQIQKDDVRTLGGNNGKGLRPCGSGDGLVGFPCQDRFYKTADVLFIFNDHCCQFLTHT